MSNDVAHSSCLKPIALPVWLAANSCCKRYSLTSYGLWMKSVYRRTTIHSTRRTIGFMHQLIIRSDTSIPAVCYARRLWCPLPCHKWVWLNWYLSTMGWRWKASITAMSCCLSRCFQQSNVSQTVVYSQNNMFLMAKLLISQGKVVALDRWGGKWNHLSMTHRLTTSYAKNYCNRTLIVSYCRKCGHMFFLGHGV